MRWKSKKKNQNTHTTQKRRERKVWVWERMFCQRNVIKQREWRTKRDVSVSFLSFSFSFLVVVIGWKKQKKKGVFVLLFSCFVVFVTKNTCEDISAPRKLSSNKTKPKEARISSNDQRKKKSVFFLHLMSGEKNICFCFDTEISSQMHTQHLGTQSDETKKRKREETRVQHLILFLLAVRQKCILWKVELQFHQKTKTACCCDCKGQKPNNLTNKNRIKRSNSSLQNKKGRQPKSSTNLVVGNTKLEVLLTNTLVALSKQIQSQMILFCSSKTQGFPHLGPVSFCKTQQQQTTTNNNNNSLEMSEQWETTASLELLSRLPFTLPLLSWTQRFVFWKRNTPKCCGFTILINIDMIKKFKDLSKRTSHTHDLQCTKNSNNMQKRFRAAKKKLERPQQCWENFQQRKRNKITKKQPFHQKKHELSCSWEKNNKRQKKSNFTKTKKNDKNDKRPNFNNFKTRTDENVGGYHHNDKTRVGGKVLCVLCAARLTRLVPDAFCKFVRQYKNSISFFVCFFCCLFVCLGEGEDLWLLWLLLFWRWKGGKNWESEWFEGMWNSVHKWGHWFSVACSCCKTNQSEHQNQK